jgi:hypothetical protein
MKNRRSTIGTIAAAALAAGGLGVALGLTLPANAATANTDTANAAAASPTYVVVNDCTLTPAVKPSAYVVACADDGSGLQGVHWTSWTSHLASAYATFYENTCDPNCADGKIVDYPALVTLWGPAALKGHPADRQYTELTVIFPGARPPVYGKGGAKTFPLTQTFDIKAT